MQHGINISAVKFDNEPFTRSLTAVLMSRVGTDFSPAVGSGIISWFFPDNITATNLSGVTYTNNTTVDVSSFGTLIFKFTAPTYDYLTESYTLFNFDIQAQFLSGSPLSSVTLTSYNVIYDTFPNINLSAYLNFETTESTRFFYRLTDPSVYIVTPSFSSTTFNLTPSLTANFFNASYTVNNTNQYSFLTALSFVRTTPSISSVSFVLSALSATGSLSAWYTPHRLECSLSAVFVNAYLTGAPFIAYPGEYFTTPYTRAAITPANLNNSPGLEFYGEGHTEYIYLSTQPTLSVDRFVWKFGNFSNIYTPTVSGTTQQLSSAVVGISSTIGLYPKIPIQLQATNSTFVSSSPLYYWDDTTGIKYFYPYVTSTVDPDGNELSTSKYFSSIVVKSYPENQYVFQPGASSIVYLAADGTPTPYQASLLVQLTAGLDSTDPCFQLYGINWKWSTFEKCSATDTFTGRPSSWATTQKFISAGLTGPLSTVSADPGRFSKKWGYELPLSADLFLTDPVFCTGSSTTWSLCTNQWDVPKFYSSPSVNPAEYIYQLQLSGYGLNSFTASYFDNTKIYLNAKKQITCNITASTYGRASDWQNKVTNLNLTHEIVSVPPTIFKFYTPNRFVLTGVPVKFENISSGVNTLCSVVIDFNDETPTIYLSGSEVDKTFYVTFSSTGLKSLDITGIVNYSPIPITFSLPNIIDVISTYDTVDPDIYQSTITPLDLPYPNKVEIAANDWAVADVFNSCIEKFYKNLEYLETRGFAYNGTYSDYFGWLGPLPLVVTPNVTSCPIYTWQEVDCSITPENFITWRDALSTETFEGRFASCGSWLQHICGNQKISPTCFQKYCVLWQWKARKRANAEIAITWKQTKTGGNYVKKWYYEVCDISSPIVCDEGFWNVNIPRLDDLYDPLGNCQVQQPCKYYGVASRNNILYIAQQTQIRLLSSNYEATFFNLKNLFDDVTAFNNIKNVCLDSENKIIVLDADLTQVCIYRLIDNVWENFISWGGVGTLNSRSRFLQPNDIHVDQFDNIWVTDKGQLAIKGFSNTGTWLVTIQDEKLISNTPLSMCVDSQNYIHILTTKEICVYTASGEYLFSYDYRSYVTDEGVRINTSYNREMIYVCTDTQVIKFFRTGKFNGYIIESKNCVNSITSIYQDEFRNLLVTTNDKVLKFADLMSLIPYKKELPNYYWKLEDLYIHPEEYIQNWVYNKSLQRLWDCIEIFRSTILYSTDQGRCKEYKTPKYQKENILVGQNEIVTSAVINRSLGYLWENFTSLLDYFDPTCPTRINP